VTRLFLIWLAAAAVLLLTANPPAWLVIFIAVVAIVLFAVLQWHAGTTVYECQECQHRFQVRAWTDFVSPHHPNKKLLECPGCKATVWCHEVDADTAADSWQL
jgi:cell division protein FtsW (lipid II flippase)